MSLPTASQLDRALKCSTSCIVQPLVKRENGYAARGTAMHKFLEDFLTIGRDEALKLVPSEYYVDCAAVDTDKILETDFRTYTTRCEIKYAYDVVNKTVRELNNNGSRDYSGVAETEVVGTCDLIVTYDDGEVIVADYKTGSYLGDPSNQNQLKFFAMCVMLQNPKLESATAEYIYIDGLGQVEKSVATFTRRDVSPLQTALIRLLADIKSKSTSPNAGSHCLYCPGFYSCPAKNAVMDHFQNVANIWDRRKFAQSIDRELSETIKEMVALGPVDIGNGRELRIVENWKRQTNDAKLVDLCRKLGATETDIAACTFTYKQLYPKAVKKNGTGE